MSLNLRVRLPRMLRELRRRLAAAHKNDVPFLAEVPVAAAPAEMDVQPFSGLVLAHTSESAAGVKVLTYWKSREHFDRESAAFARSIGATSISWQGYVRDYQASRERWYRRVPWYTLLVTLFAILGAYDNGRLQMNRLAAKPELQLSVERQGDFNYFVNDPIDERVFIENHIPVEQRIRVVSADLYARDSPLHLLTVEGTGIGELREAETTHIRLLGRVATPGPYILRVLVAARAGHFRDEKTFSVTRQIVVWQRLPRAEKPKVMKVENGVATVLLPILVGEPATKGLKITLRLPRHPDVTDVVTTYPGAAAPESWAQHGTPGNEMAMRTFTTAMAIPSFRQVPMRFAMVGTASTPWDQVMDHLAIHVAANN